MVNKQQLFYLNCVSTSGSTKTVSVLYEAQTLTYETSLQSLTVKGS